MYAVTYDHTKTEEGFVDYYDTEEEARENYNHLVEVAKCCNYENVTLWNGAEKLEG